mgnify:FL=1
MKHIDKSSTYVNHAIDHTFVMPFLQYVFVLHIILRRTHVHTLYIVSVYVMCSRL